MGTNYYLRWCDEEPVYEAATYGAVRYCPRCEMLFAVRVLDGREVRYCPCCGVWLATGRDWEVS